MNPYLLEMPPTIPARTGRVALPVLLGKRLANIVLTAQVQFAYACATDARDRALSALERITKTWPPTPVRTLVLNNYRAQADTASRMAGDVLQGAQRRCGLAYARY